MKQIKLMMVLLFLSTGTVVAQQQANVTPLMSKDLTEIPGKEVLMITVEYPPGSMDPIHRHNAHAYVYTSATRPGMAEEHCVRRICLDFTLQRVCDICVLSAQTNTFSCPSLMTIPLNHEANNAIHPHARILFVDDDDDSDEMLTTLLRLAVIEAKQLERPPKAL